MTTKKRNKYSQRTIDNILYVMRAGLTMSIKDITMQAGYTSQTIDKYLDYLIATGKVHIAHRAFRVYNTPGNPSRAVFVDGYRCVGGTVGPLKT